MIACGMEVAKSEVAEIATKVGLVFQNPFTQITGSKLTVYEEIAFGLENIGIERSEMKCRIEHALDLLGISKFKDKNPFDLSGPDAAAGYCRNNSYGTGCHCIRRAYITAGSTRV